MQTPNALCLIATCLGGLLLAAPTAVRAAGESPAADAAYLAQATAELQQAGSEPMAVVPEHYQPCTGGTSGGVYPCANIDQMEFMSHTLFGTDAGDSVKTNSLWGWTDPETGHEWVLLGLNNGTAFIDITDPENPLYAGKLPSHNGIVSTWRDVREYQNYAYIVVDNGGAHGMQVFDLTQLRDVALPPVTFTETAHYAGVTNTHTISITKETGYAYLVGSNTCSGGLHIVSLADPANPQFVTCYDDGGYIHENQCFLYHGPDTAYTGHEICLAARGSAHNLDVLDVTNHAVPVRIDSLHYNSVGYSHQAWFTDDQRYILLNDELDEQQGGTPTRTHVFDALDLDSLVKAGANGYFTQGTPAIDHNLYVRANFVFESNYTSGFRILALTDLAQAQLTEIGYFDLFPANNNATFDGTWNNYPFFESGNIPVSHISQGLFILHPTNLCSTPATPSALVATPNGANRIDLDWTGSAAPGRTFKVQRALGGCGGTFQTIASGLASPTYDDLSASGVVTYGYRIQERDATGICGSATSTCVEASTSGACTAPPAFAGIASATNQATAACAVDLTWPAGTVYCGGPATYSVYRGATDNFVPSPGNRIAQGVPGLAYSDAGAPPLTPSYYVVRAVDAASGNEDTNIVHLGATATGPSEDGTFASGAEPGDPPLDTLGGGLDEAIASPEPLAPEHAGWHLSSDRKRTGTRSFYSIDANNVCITLEVPVTLTAAQSSQLSFWTIWDTEAGWDGGIVQVSTNGGATWSLLTPNPPGYPNVISHTGNSCPALANGTPAFSSANQLATWQQRTVDLSAYAGQNIRLAWRYGTDPGTIGEGWYVDDIALTHAQIPGSCTSNLIFADGFGTGTTGAWSAAVP